MPNAPTAAGPTERWLGDPPSAEALPALADRLSAADHFALLGVSRGYDVDAGELRTGFLAASRAVHPDRFGGADDAALSAAMRLSAQVNRAYEALGDPIQRAAYLLEMAGGRSAAEDKRVPQDVLNRALMVREEIEEARASSNAAQLAALRDGVLAEKVAEEARVADLARRLAAGQDVRDELRLRLNAMKYVQNLVAQF